MATQVRPLPHDEATFSPPPLPNFKAPPIQPQHDIIPLDDEYDDDDDDGSSTIGDSERLSDRYFQTFPEFQPSLPLAQARRVLQATPSEPIKIPSSLIQDDIARGRTASPGPRGRLGPFPPPRSQTRAETPNASRPPDKVNPGVSIPATDAPVHRSGGSRPTSTAAREKRPPHPFEVPRPPRAVLGIPPSLDEVPPPPRAVLGIPPCLDDVPPPPPGFLGPECPRGKSVSPLPAPRLDQVPPPPPGLLPSHTHPRSPQYPEPTHSIEVQDGLESEIEETEEEESDGDESVELNTRKENTIETYRDLRAAYREMALRCDEIEEHMKQKDELAVRVYKLEDQLNLAFRQAMSSGPRLRDYAPVFRQLLGLREEYKRAEDHLKQLVQDLREAQNDADERQTQFLGLYVMEVEENAPNNLDQSTFPPSQQPHRLVKPAPVLTERDELLLGISGDIPSLEKDPLYRDLEDAVGQLHLAQESRGVLLRANMAYKEALKNLEMSKAHLGEPVTPRDMEKLMLQFDSAEMLEDYEQNDQETAEDVIKWRSRVNQLAAQCKDQGVLPRNAPFIDEYGKYNPQVENINLPNPRRGDISRIEHHKFPKLVSYPVHIMARPLPMTAAKALKEIRNLPSPIESSVVDRRTKEMEIEHPFRSLLSQPDGMDKTDFINRWLLHQLRIGPMEALQLFNVFGMFLKIKNPQKWQSDVLRLWNQDEAAFPPHVTSPSETTSIAIETIDTMVPSRAKTISPPVPSSHTTTHWTRFGGGGSS